MSEAIRVLHFADSHIGMENYGRIDGRTGLNSRVIDFLRRMDEMIAYAGEHEVDLTIFAGDAFKTRAPNPTFQREFAWRVRDLAALAPVVLLVGNHDLPPTALKASSIEIYETLAVPNVWVASEYTVRRIETKRGPVVVAAAPYPIRARILEDVQTMGITIAQTDALLQEKLTDILENLAEEADDMAEPDNAPRLLTGHFTVNGAVLGSERNIMLGRDITVLPSSLADPRWDYVALGHIHKHQDLSKGRQGVPPVVYSGSIERIDFGEEGDPKGFCWVQLKRDQTRWRFIELKARPFVTLRADLRESTNPTQDAVNLIEKHNLDGAVVRVFLSITAESEARLNEGAVREALRRANVSFVSSIVKETEQTDRARLGANPEGLTSRQLLEHYLISKEIPPERRQALADVAQEIFASDSDF